MYGKYLLYTIFPVHKTHRPIRHRHFFVRNFRKK